MDVRREKPVTVLSDPTVADYRLVTLKPNAGIAFIGWRLRQPVDLRLPAVPVRVDVSIGVEPSHRQTIRIPLAELPHETGFIAWSFHDKTEHAMIIVSRHGPSASDTTEVRS